MDRPLANSYWVIPGRLLAGEYPIGEGGNDARTRIARLRDHRINSFVDLTEEREMPAYRHLLPVFTTYTRFAIPDQGVPQDPAELRKLLKDLVKAMEAQRCIYVHCRAGIGRTGLTIGCYLAQLRNDGAAALAELNSLWSQSERSMSWARIPQTQEQADYIKRWPSVVKSLASLRAKP